MRAKVRETFRDKHTKEIYEKGKTITITRERFDEVSEALPGFLEEVLPKKKSRK